jgi:regulator of protease activity HflC (stomatin/prohibitin superfamily)
MLALSYLPILIAILGVVTVFKAVRVVPQQSLFVVERLGRYLATLDAGLYFIVPFVDHVRYKHSIKEVVLEVPEQICITKDNVQVAIDGVLFYRVIDGQRASYGVQNYEIALIQLAQTTLRSEIGRLQLDHAFEEREKINGSIVVAIDKASDPWGVKVLRYELRAINPPREVLLAMEKQMKAEREKRAVILESEGDRDAKINRAEGIKQETIKNSEAIQQKQINEAQGQASAILAVASATANGLHQIAEALASPGGQQAAQLKIAEEYVKQFGNLAKQSTTMLLPASANDIAGTLATAFALFKEVGADGRAIAMPGQTIRTDVGGGMPTPESPWKA